MGVCGLLLLVGLVGGAFYSKRKQAATKVLPASPTQYLVADSIFDKVAGSKNKAISLKALSDYLITRPDVSVKEIQAIFNQLDTNGDGSVDRDEWRVGFTNGIIPGSGSK